MLQFVGIFFSLLCFSSTLAQAQEVFPFVGKIIAPQVNIRAGQNANFELLGRLKEGDEVVVLGASYDWRKIRLPLEAKAYVNAAYVKDLGEGIGEVQGNRLNIRAGVSVNAALIGQLKKGEGVRILEKEKDWLRIEPPSESYGWVLSQFLQKTDKEIPPVRIVSILNKQSLSRNDIDQVKESSLKLETIEIKGKIESLGQEMLSSNVRHCLKSDQMIYHLYGYRNVIDGFFNQNVLIEGRIKSKISADRQVLLVTKIVLRL